MYKLYLAMTVSIQYCPAIHTFDGIQFLFKSSHNPTEDRSALSWNHLRNNEPNFSHGYFQTHTNTHIYMYISTY